MWGRSGKRPDVAGDFVFVLGISDVCFADPSRAMRKPRAVDSPSRSGPSTGGSLESCAIGRFAGSTRSSASAAHERGDRGRESSSPARDEKAGTRCEDSEESVSAGSYPRRRSSFGGGQEAIPLAEPLANASDGTGGTAGSAEGNGAAVSLARVRDGGGAPRRRAGADVSAGAPAAGRAGQIDSNGPDIGRAGTRHRRDHEAIADVHDSSVNRIEGRPASLGCSTSAAETLRPGTVLRDERSGVDLSAEERAASPRRCSRSGFASRAGSSRIAGYRVLAGPRPGSCRSPWSHPRRWRPHLPIRI